MKYNYEYNGEDNEVTWDNVSILRMSENGELQILVLQYVLISIMNGREYEEIEKISVTGEAHGYFFCFF